MDDWYRGYRLALDRLAWLHQGNPLQRAKAAARYCQQP